MCSSEYAAYRLYNVMTPESLKVRLARMRYMDGDDKKPIAERWGFFIEDIDDRRAAAGGKELAVPSMPSKALDSKDAARYVLFQYMIGNLDWDMGRGPEGSDCCHNSKLVGTTAEATEGLIPVPYDFDYAGLINAPYAVPPESLNVRSVTTRYYRGLCRHNADVQAAAKDYLAARPALEAELRGMAQLDAKSRDEMLSFLGGFFEDIATPEQVEKKLAQELPLRRLVSGQPAGAGLRAFIGQHQPSVGHDRNPSVFRVKLGLEAAPFQHLSGAIEHQHGVVPARDDQQML